MSVLLTRLQNIRSNTNLDKNENRGSRYGALMAFLKQTDQVDSIVTPAMKTAALAAIGSTQEVPVIDFNSAITVTNTRTVTIPDAENTSRMVTITYSTITAGFTQTESLFINNELGAQQDFEAKLKATINVIGKTVDSLCVTELNASKTQVIEDPLIYRVEADTLIATFAQREEVVGDLEVIQGANDYYDSLDVIGNPGFMKVVNNLKELGEFNQRWNALQLEGKTYHFSNRVDKPAGKAATLYFVPSGNLGILFRFEPEALLNTKTNIGFEWTTGIIPELNIPSGIYTTESVGDETALAGAASAELDRAFKKGIQWSFDVAIFSAYNSDPAGTPSPIAKFVINTVESDTDSTAPLVATVDSADTSNVTVNFDSVMCTDKAGTIITGDIKALFTIAAGGAITSATASADGKSVVFVIVDTSLSAADTITVAADILFDGAGNAFVAAAVTKVNAGDTAWELV